MEHEIQFFEDEHIYLVDGEEVPSVTTILSPITQSEYGVVNPSVLAYAARRGTEVHEYLEQLDYGNEPEEFNGEIAPYLLAYKKFMRDWKIIWEGVETLVYEPVLGFVGTLDRVGILDGRRVIVDIKTLNSPTKLNKFSVCCQTAAYEMAYMGQTGKIVDSRYALYLGKDGDYNFFSCEEYEEKYGLDPYDTFKCYLEINSLTRLLRDAKPIKKGVKNGNK